MPEKFMSKYEQLPMPEGEKSGEEFKNKSESKIIEDYEKKIVTVEYESRKWEDVSEEVKREIEKILGGNEFTVKYIDGGQDMDELGPSAGWLDIKVIDKEGKSRRFSAKQHFEHELPRGRILRQWWTIEEKQPKLDAGGKEK